MNITSRLTRLEREHIASEGFCPHGHLTLTQDEGDTDESALDALKSKRCDLCGLPKKIIIIEIVYTDNWRSVPTG